MFLTCKLSTQMVWFSRIRRVESLCEFVDPHVRDVHILGKNGSGIGISGPPPNRDIQKNIERMVENPICLVRESSSTQSGIVNTIHKEVKVVGIQLQRKDAAGIIQAPVRPRETTEHTS